MVDLACVICGAPIPDGIGHNAAPVKDGRCCDACNTTRVIPERLYRLSPQRRSKKD